MIVELSETEISLILESFEYSKINIRDAQGTPYDVHQENLRRIDKLSQKLRKLE